MRYLAYDEYITMGGKIDNAAFNRFELQSRREVDYYTHGRIDSDSKSNSDLKSLPYHELLQALMFELVELSSKYDLTSDEKTIVSSSNNGISVNYQNATTQEVTTARKKLITNYLNGLQDLTGIDLLWAGV